MWPSDDTLDKIDAAIVIVSVVCLWFATGKGAIAFNAFCIGASGAAILYRRMGNLR